MSSTYRTLLRAPDAAAFFLTASIGRVGIAMTSLGLVWLVHGRTGSYAVAGLVTGGFAVAEAVVGPQVARAVDRLGQTRVLPPVLVLHATAVAGLVVVVTGGRPVWSMVGAGVLAGATIPQLGALSAARWSALLRRDVSALPTAFALESVSNASAYLVGPVLVSAVAGAGHPVIGTLLSTSLVVCGGLALAAQHRTAPPPAGPSTGRSRAGTSPRGRAFVALVGISVGIGAYFGAVQVSVTAFAVESGAPGVAALLFGVSSGVGLVAGWAYGLRRWRAAPATQLAVATTGLAAACLLLLAADSPVTVAIGLAAAALTVPPVLVLCSVLAEAAVPRVVLTQAFTWLNSASAAGTAGVAAVSGRVVDGSGSRGGFAIAATAAAAVATLAGLHAVRGSARVRT